MSARTTKKSRSQSSVKGYTLWTSPPETWAFPVQTSKLPANAENKIRNLKATKNDKQIAPFRTSVTPDVLEITVK